MAAADTKVADPKGLKRICPSCGTRYFDLNKRPIICPSCTVEFKSEIKTKGRGRRLAAANDEAKAKPVAKPIVADEEAADIVAEGDEEVVSLTDVEDLEETEEEDEDLDALDPDLADDADLESIDDADAEDDEDDEDDEEDDEE